ncbi:MAG TPA: TonB family protein, partial [Phenylobacterium sp.]
MRAWLGLAAALFVIGAAHAADVNDPVWDQAPGQDAWAKAYPARAASAGIAGAVKMKCAATTAGQLSNCSVIQEAPTGEGFGAAALSLATQMALKPADAEGKPVAGRSLIVPVKFEPALLQHPGTIIGLPDWFRKPTQDEMLQFFPADAGGVAGKTALECIVSTRGLLQKCEVKMEAPQGHGFGAAALAMSSVFLMRPMTRDGLPVGGARVIIPINFGEGYSGPVEGRITVLRAAPWMSTPTAEAMAAAFPKSSVGKAESGHVVLRCGIRNDGSLRDCDTLSETPSSRGFAGAARALSKDFRAYVDPKKDHLANVRVDVPFDFRDTSQGTTPGEVYDPIWLKRPDPNQVIKL